MARRKNQPKTPPAVRPMRMSGRTGRLFSAKDVQELANRQGITILADSEIHNAVAHDLDEAFDDAIIFQRHEQEKTSPSELVGWFQDVEAKATAILNVIGFPTGKATLHSHDLAFPVRSQAVPNLIDGVFMNPDLLPLYVLLPEQVRHALNDGKDGPTVNDLLNNNFELPDGLNPWDYLMGMSTSAACSLLKASPWIIALIAELGHLQAEFYSQTTGKRGDRKDTFTPTLFTRLHGAFVKLTGKAPILRIQRERDPNSPAVLWAKAVCEMTLSEKTLNGECKARIQHVFRPISSDEVDAIRKITKLSGETIIAHFERGKNDWSAMQQLPLHKD